MNRDNKSKELREIIRIMERKLGILEKSEVACCGVTFAQCHAIVEIGRAGSISLNELAEILDLDNSTMSRTVNNLVNSDLTEREIDPKDRRYVTIGLTESGKKVFETIEKSMGIYFTSIYEALPEEKREQVLDSLKILLDAIDKSNCCGRNRYF